MTIHYLQSLINDTYESAASQYESEAGHGMSDAEKAEWQADIFSVVNFTKQSQVLDVGAGTGVFTRLLAIWGCSVVGIEPSAGMLQQAKSYTHQSPNPAIDFRLGDTHDSSLFVPQVFDRIVSRQVVCYFYDPLLAFQNWHKWLKDDGQVVVIDGLWFREGWSNDDLVDKLPLSCLQTRATVGYLLEKAGFSIETNGWLERVNQYLMGAGNLESPRYIVVARKARR